MIGRFGFCLVAAAVASAGVTPARPAPQMRTGACGKPEASAPWTRVTVPMALEGNQVRVTVCVAGQPLNFILDTGAAQTFIDLATARRLRLSLGAPLSARGAGPGTIGGAVARHAVLTVPGLPGTQKISGALDFPRRRTPGVSPVDGILGSDFFDTHVVAIDYAESRLVVYAPKTFVYAGGGPTLPLTFDNGHPHVDGAVRLADGEVIPGRFVLDIGAAGGIALTTPFVQDHRLDDRVGPTLRRPAGVGVGGETTAVFGRIAGLRLGHVELTNVIAGLHEESSGVFGQRGFWVANIGNEILGRFTVYFDYPRARMMLEPNRSFDAPFEMDMSGLGFGMNPDGAVTIAFVVPGTPATDAGFERGDVIVAVDGTSQDGRSVMDLRQRCRRPDERITFAIRRGSDEKILTLVTRRLV